MQITHLGHSCVLLETGGQRILFDPGNFSDAWHGLTGLDAVVITHQHPDHVDPDQLPALLEANPDARVFAEHDVEHTVRIPHVKELPPGLVQELGDVELEPVGGWHAVIHRDIPRIGNVGVVVRAPGEPTFFHPGDALEYRPEGVDVVAVPMHGPWAAMKEHIDFLRALQAPYGFGIHDGLLNDRGWKLAFDRYREMTDTDVQDLRDGRPWTVPARTT